MGKARIKFVRAFLTLQERLRMVVKAGRLKGKIHKVKIKRKNIREKGLAQKCKPEADVKKIKYLENIMLKYVESKCGMKRVRVFMV